MQVMYTVKHKNTKKIIDHNTKANYLILIIFVKHYSGHNLPSNGYSSFYLTQLMFVHYLRK